MPSVLSRRYARALADAVQPHGGMERVRDELNALAAAMSRSRELSHLASTARQSRRQKADAFARISRDLGLSVHTARLLGQLATARRITLLPNLALSFTAEADRRLGIRRAVVTSAVPLGDAQRGAIVRRLEALTGGRIVLREEVDMSLIAGFRVHLDGAYFDGSLRGKLEKMRERIAHG